MARETQFTRGKISASGPAFSPDGEWLAFTSQRSGAEGARRRLTHTSLGDFGQWWEAFPETRALLGRVRISGHLRGIALLT
ncbi:MAG: hypothetical protein CM1200mP14_22920 [Gammaproteobacteria bacterium]|nr:MAG: hypothetical protein CM1200mP14_22920 [Gammaproteobacteria bacterium]